MQMIHYYLRGQILEQAIVLKSVVRIKINFNKSQLLFLGNKDIRKSIIEKILRCGKGKFPILYLGIPIRPEKLRREDWMGLIERKAKDWMDGKVGCYR